MTRLVIALSLGLILAVALAARLTALDSYGFSDDESSKVRAVAAYRAGDFTANAEHPMLMKLTMWGSVALADRWNAVAPMHRITPETALRLPHALVGGAAVVVVFAVVTLLFDPATGLVAAALIALDPNITALNRIGKED